MIERAKIRTAVFHAVEQANQLSGNGDVMAAQESAVLLGTGAALDSMGYINFVVALEEQIGDLTGRRLDIVERIQAAEASGQPVSTVGQVIDLVCGALQS